MTYVDTDKIISRLGDIKDKTILVIGDFCLDKYVYSDPKEDDISVESGKAAWQIYEKKTAAGVAGTITNNICSLGAKVLCVGFLGDDGEGYELKKALKRVGADPSYMISTDKLVTGTYFKPMRKTENGYEEDIRFDFRNANPPTVELANELFLKFKEAVKFADGVVISDQFYERNTGVVSDYVRDGLNELAKEYDIPFLVDSRAFAKEFKNAYVKCNNFELMNYCGADGDPESREDVIKGSKKLSEITGSPVLITRNKDGVIIYDNGEVSEIPAYPVHGEIDVTGAGDATNAGLIIGLSLGLTPAEAAKIACAVSSVTIHKLGETGTSTVEEITEVLKQNI